mgnify:CR=1 FL=1
MLQLGLLDIFQVKKKINQLEFEMEFDSLTP